jgi:hypothetical protein
MDAGAALVPMRELLAPGGTLAIVGLPRPRYPGDLPFAAAFTAASREGEWRWSGRPRLLEGGGGKGCAPLTEII